MNSVPDYLHQMKDKLLQKGSEKAAWRIVDAYFHFMGIGCLKEELWILKKGNITNDLMEQSEKGIDLTT